MDGLSRFWEDEYDGMKKERDDLASQLVTCRKTIKDMREILSKIDAEVECLSEGTTLFELKYRIMELVISKIPETEIEDNYEGDEANTFSPTTPRLKGGKDD